MRELAGLLRHLVKGEPDRARALLGGGTVPAALLQALADSRLQGYLHVLLDANDALDLLPPAAAETCLRHYREQARRSAGYLELTGDIAGRLDAAAIPLVCLKGLYTAHRFFGDIRHRFMWDLDILVRPEDLPAAARALGDLGLAPRVRVPVDPRRARWGIHAVELRGPRGKVDVHVALRHLPGVAVNHERLWQAARPCTIEGVTFPAASDEDTLYMALLGVGTDMQKGVFNARKLWDLYMILRALDSAADWRAFLALREAEGARRLVLNVLAFAVYRLDAAADCPRLVATLRDNAPDLVVTGSDQARALCDPARSALDHRRFFAGLLPVSALHYWSWWLLTSPVRNVFYRRTGAKARAGLAQRDFSRDVDTR